VQTASGSRTHKRISLSVRAIVLAICVLALILAFATFTPEDVGPLNPPPNVIGSTWYGSLLVVLVPIALGWLCFAIDRRWLRVLSLSLTLLLLFVCLLEVYGTRYILKTLPEFLRFFP
jgi:hypothetical protein